MVIFFQEKKEKKEKKKKREHKKKYSGSSDSDSDKEGSPKKHKVLIFGKIKDCNITMITRNNA